MEKRPTAVSWYSSYSIGESALFRTFLVLALLGWIASCGGDSPSGPDPADTKVSSVSLTPGTNSLSFVGETAQLSAAAKNASGNTVSGTTFQWSSSSSTVATVSGTGLVTAVGNGTATITATANGTTVSSTAQVTVQQAVADVSVSPPEGDLNAGATLQLSATATDAGGAELGSASFTWSSSDDALASVSADGLVTGKAGGGTVVITATSGGASGSASLAMSWTNLEISVDSNLSGTYLVDEFTVAAGVTVTATDDLTIDATGYVEILGTITGDCVAMAVQGDTAVTVMGTVNNGCAAGADGEDLSIVADGELTLEDATIISSGDMTFANDPTLTDVDFPESAPTSVSGRGSNDTGPRKAGSGVPFTRVNRTTVRYSGGETGPDPAKNGVDGVDGTPGEAGRNVKMRLRGNAEFAGGTLLWGQDGGRGGDGYDTQPNDISASGGKGGDGGKISVFITGTLTYSGGENVVRSGSGGWGGDATAVAQGNDAGNKAPSATATAADGGIPGLLDIRSGGGINVASAGALVLEVGLPGEGGEAIAIGADGRDALGATVPAQEGGNASATAGKGGSTPDKQLIKQGNVTGSPPILRGATNMDLDGGTGGESDASAGNGGDGIQTNKPGGDGGSATSFGGWGGDALIKGLSGALVGNGGDGGRAVFTGGNGGNGWSDCRPLEPVEEGGAGGDGGSTTGNEGVGGLGLAQGAGGETYFENVGNGGNGGDGEEPGAMGQKGTQGSVTGVTTVVDPAFMDGVPGANCPVAEPVEYRMHLDQVESQAGVLQPGVTQTAALTETGGSGTGTIQFTPVGALFALFHALDDPRLGVQGGEGNGIEFDFGSIVLENAEAIANGVTFCFANTSGVSGANPIRILQLTVLREIIKETLVTNPAFQACSAISLEPTTRIVFVTLAAGAIIDILAPLLFLTLF